MSVNTSIKRFVEWVCLKENLHSIENKPPLVSQSDIWWASLGENIGSEINGKSKLFSRPVIIFKKLAHGFYFVIPTTTQIRNGSWYIKFRHHEVSMVACLHQARALDYRRLSSKLGTLDDEDYSTIKKGFDSLYLK